MKRFSHYRELAAVGGIGCAWFLAIALLVAHSLPYNPLQGMVPEGANLRMFVPEGWGFFTKSPRERQYTVVRRSGDGWVPAQSMPVSNPANVFGLNRAVRGSGVELSTLLKDVPNDAWVECEDADEACLARVAAPTQIANASIRPTLCGELGVVMREPVPWAWRDAATEIHMPAVVTTLQAQCS